MNSIEIETILNAYKWNKFKFLGCFAADQLPDVELRQIPVCFIANVEASNESGSHWVAFIIPKDGYCEYFCSLGISFYHWPLFTTYIRNSMCFESTLMNRKQIQSSNSNLCALYCIEFLIQRDRGLSFATILNKYSTHNLLCNDLQTLNFFRDFKKKYHIN